MGKVTIHAGHNPDGKIGCGAVGLIKESTENRNVVASMMSQCSSVGLSLVDCTVNNGTSKNDVLVKLVDKMNAANADYNVSVHFNSGADDAKGNGKTTGVEVLLYNASSELKAKAENVCKVFEAAGFKNRGIKYRPNLYIMKHTTKPTMLIEVCFVDDADDVASYKKVDAGALILEGLTGKKPAKKTETGSGSTVINPNPKVLAAGDKVELLNVKLYSSAYTGTASSTKTGTYYIYDSNVVKGRIRITNKKTNVGKSTTGWVDVVDITGTPAPETTTVTSGGVTTTATGLTTGAKITLKNVPCYATSAATSASSKKTGTFYIYDSKIVKGRIRITNTKANVGKAATGWVNVADITGTVSSVAFAAGDKVTLKQTPVYASSTATVAASKKSGTYYIHSPQIVKNRIRITNTVANVGKSVTGYVNVADIQ